jgi:hypothetical protein
VQQCDTPLGGEKKKKKKKKKEKRDQIENSTRDRTAPSNANTRQQQQQLQQPKLQQQRMIPSQPARIPNAPLNAPPATLARQLRSERRHCPAPGARGLFQRCLVVPVHPSTGIGRGGEEGGGGGGGGENAVRSAGCEKTKKIKERKKKRKKAGRPRETEKKTTTQTKKHTQTKKQTHPDPPPTNKKKKKKKKKKSDFLSKITVTKTPDYVQYVLKPNGFSVPERVADRRRAARELPLQHAPVPGREQRAVPRHRAQVRHGPRVGRRRGRGGGVAPAGARRGYVVVWGELSVHILGHGG